MTCHCDIVTWQLSPRSRYIESCATKVTMSQASGAGINKSNNRRKVDLRCAVDFSHAGMILW